MLHTKDELLDIAKEIRSNDNTPKQILELLNDGRINEALTLMEKLKRNR